MWRKAAGGALSEATRDVLEKMCFVAADEIPGPAAAALPSILAQVEFRGQWIGRCMVEMPESCARLIAGNFTGVLNPDEVDPMNMVNLMCEFVNMVCGGTISRMQCSGIVTLAPPHLIWTWPHPLDRAQQPAVECWLDMGEGIVHVGFETEFGS